MRWPNPSQRRTGAAILSIVAIALLAWSIRPLFSSPPQADYPYWCLQCRATFGLAELNADGGKNWRPWPGKSDSVVACLRCDKGPAYPAPRCIKCGTHHLIHVDHDGRCPRCYPEVAERAAQQGLNLTPAELQ